MESYINPNMKLATATINSLREDIPLVLASVPSLREISLNLGGLIVVYGVGKDFSKMAMYGQYQFQH